MDLIKYAASQLGVQEISGNEHNEQILNYAKETGINGISTDEIPWCSTFINWCAMKAGLPKSGKANARSWIHIGTKVQKPETGDVVVFWRESPTSWKGHVGLFMGFNANGTKVFCLGGNQGNAVSVSSYDAKKVLGFRRLRKIGKLLIPEPTLKLKSKGAEVIKLQEILIFLNCKCGDADGFFGKKTEAALKLLQANNGLIVDGQYGPKTKDCIEGLMQV